MADFAELFGNELMSDCVVLLEEEGSVLPSSRASSGAASARKRQKKTAAASDTAPAAGTDDNKKTLPCHKNILWVGSSFFKAKLEHWSSNSTSAKAELYLTVPTGQLQLGELLVKGMYAAKPDVSSCSQEQLLQLLLLADRYGVLKVTEAVTAAVSSIPPAELQLSTVVAVYLLPAGCAEDSTYRGLYGAAQQWLQLNLGDLEVVLADRQGEKMQALLSLPQPAFKQLLQDPATRVASENTVFAAIKRWWEQHDHEQPRNRQQRQQHEQVVAGVQELVGLVRIKHCTQHLMSTVMARSTLASLCFDMGDMAEACVYSSAVQTKQKDAIAAIEGYSKVLKKYPAWSAEQRPASAMVKLDLQWKLPLRELKALLDDHAKDTTKEAGAWNESSRSWQGQEFTLSVEVSSDADGTYMGVFIEATGLPSSAVRLINFNLSIKASHNAAASIDIGKNTRAFHENLASWGRLYMVEFGSVVPSWRAAQAKLRELELVHSDNCLHIQGQVLNME